MNGFEEVRIDPIDELGRLIEHVDISGEERIHDRLAHFPTGTD